MNNGQYVGPIISRNSPRWRMQELVPPLATVAVNGNSFLCFEPYIPPTVTAVMVTATAGSNITGTTSNSAASCHNLIFPMKQRRLFVEMSTFVRLYLVSEADLMSSTDAAILTNAEIAVYLNSTGSAGTAVVYSRNTTQFTVNSDTTLPFLNGVIAAGISNPREVSLIDPRLRRTGSGTIRRLNPGNLQWPMRSSLGLPATSPGAGCFDASNAASHSYVRLEYLL